VLTPPVQNDFSVNANHIFTSEQFYSRTSLYRTPWSQSNISNYESLSD